MDNIDTKRGTLPVEKLSRITTMSTMSTKLVELVIDVVCEITRSIELHGRTNSVHEALGIMEEEYAEYKAEVFAYNPKKGRDTRARMRTELTHIAAVAIKAIYCLEMPKEEPYVPTMEERIEELERRVEHLEQHNG
jgi:hypothetical protein